MLLCIGEVTETLALVVDDEVVVESTAAVLLLFFGGPMARVPMIERIIKTQRRYILSKRKEHRTGKRNESVRTV